MSDTPLGYYKWYPRDFATSIVVRSMPFTARAIYRELLDIQWESGCLPDAKRLLSVIGANVEQWNEFAPYIDELFPNGRNPKLETMRNEAVLRSQKNKVSGSIGGQSKRTTSKPRANAKRTLSQTETETETETSIKEKNTKRKCFVEPTLEEVRSYMTSEGFDGVTHAPEFLDYYQSNGWKAGRNPMVDWKASARGWCRRSKVQPSNGTSKKELYHD